MANSIKFPVLHKNKNINLAIYLAIVALILIVAYKAYKKYRPGSAAVLPVGSTAQEVKQTSNGTVTYDNNTVFSVKSPYMKSDRIQWMQYKYNQFVLWRKSARVTPEWPTISEDGVFGPKTADAVARVLGKKTASWTEFSAKVDALKNQISIAGAGITSGGSKDPNDIWGYNFG